MALQWDLSGIIGKINHRHNNNNDNENLFCGIIMRQWYVMDIRDIDTGQE